MKVLVLGAGQLARMMALAGAPLNITLSAYDVASKKVMHPLTKEVYSRSLEQAIQDVDVITAEFEHIPHDILERCDASGKLRPSIESIKTGGDRRLEKQCLEKVNVPNADFAIIQDRKSFDTAIQTLGLPLVLKTALGGYDGKGQWRLKSANHIEQVWQEIAQVLAENDQQGIVAETFVPFEREVSLVGARSLKGEFEFYPLTENVHTDGILSLSTALLKHDLQTQAENAFKALTNDLNYTGVLAIEFFEVDGKLLVNEIAPRVHNSGHWTQQGAETCQFENHLRSVCGFPLGSGKLTRHAAMINIIGVDSIPDAIYAHQACHVHWYGKDKQLGRKMGHINVCTDSSQALKATLSELGKILDPSEFPALS